MGYPVWSLLTCCTPRAAQSERDKDGRVLVRDIREVLPPPSAELRLLLIVSELPLLVQPPGQGQGAEILLRAPPTTTSVMNAGSSYLSDSQGMTSTVGVASARFPIPTVGGLSSHEVPLRSLKWRGDGKRGSLTASAELSSTSSSSEDASSSLSLASIAALPRAGWISLTELMEALFDWKAAGRMPGAEVVLMNGGEGTGCESTIKNVQNGAVMRHLSVGSISGRAEMPHGQDKSWTVDAGQKGRYAWSLYPLTLKFDGVCTHTFLIT